MPRIPRSRDNYETFKPSAAPIIPMGLADYSAWTDALDKVTGFAANKADQKNDEKAKLDLDDFNNQSDETIQKHELYPYDLSGPREGTKPASMEATTQGKMDAFTNDLDSVYPTEEQLSDMKSRHRVAFEASRNAAISKFRSSLRLKESKTLVAKNKANALTFDTKTLTDISDLNKSLTPVLSAMEGNWKRREDNALNGGLMENPHQVRVAKIAFYTKLGKALKGRFDEGFIGLMDHGVITSRKDLEEQGITGTKGVSVGRYDSYMQYYRDMFHNGEIAGYKLKLLFPDQSKEAVARESHDLIFGELTKNRTARQTGATATFNSFMNDTMERAHAEQRDFLPSEVARLHHLAFLSGRKISARVFNFRERMRTKPTTFQKIRNDQLELKFQKIINDAVDIGAEPDFTAFSGELAEAFVDNTLHASDAMKMYKELSSQKGKQAGRINTAVSDIIKKVRAKVYIKPQVGGTGKKKVDDMRFDLFNEDMPGNVERSVRSRVRAEILRSGDKAPDLDKVYQETLEYINETVRAKNPSTIHIDRDELEDVYRIKSQGGELSPREQLVFDLSLAKINRNSRFARRASEFMAAHKKAVRAGGGDFARFKDKYKRELAFLQPGNYSYEKMYQKYFMVPKKEVVSPTESKESVDQDIDLPDPNAKVEEPVVEEPVGDSTDEEAVGSVDEANLSNEQKDAAVLAEEQQNIESAPEISMSIASEGGSAPEGELVAETSAEEVVAANKEYYDRVDQFRAENKDMSFSQRMSKFSGAKTTEERAKYVSDWIYESDKVLNNVLGPAWADLKQSFREDNAAFGRLADAIVKEYGDPEHENPPLEELPRLLFQAIHPAAKNFTQWLQGALSGKRGIEPTATIKTRSPKPQSTAVAKKVLPEKEATAIRSPLVTVLEREGVPSAKLRSKSADQKEALGEKIRKFNETPFSIYRNKVVAAIKKMKKNVVSIASLGGDFFSPKKRAEDIAKLLGESWIKIEKPSLPIASKGKDKLGMKRGDAYNYMFELSVNVLRNKRISKRDKDKMRNKLKKFSEMQVDSMGKSQEPVDDYVVILVRELEMMIKAPRFFELGVF